MCEISEQTFKIPIKIEVLIGELALTMQAGEDQSFDIAF
jgi:hypothetical protein